MDISVWMQGQLHLSPGAVCAVAMAVIAARVLVEVYLELALGLQAVLKPGFAFARIFPASPWTSRHLATDAL